MNGSPAVGPSDVDLKIKEAETCYAMGMFEESLILYEHVIASGKSIPPQARQALSEKVGRLKKEILERQASERKGLSPEDISILRKTMSKQNDFPALLDGAAALKELGLIKEAVAEYEKLLALEHTASNDARSDYAPGKIIVDYLTCLLEVEDPAEVVQKTTKIIYQQNLDEKAAASVKSWLGQQMEQRDLYDLAFELYKTAAEINPADEGIAGRLNVLKGKLASNSRYDYLIRSKVVTANQLQEALAIAKKINKSVDFVLVDRFKIDVQELGKSLAMFYGCPFRRFDPDLPIPVELIGRLKKAFLLHYAWVPLSWNKGGWKSWSTTPTTCARPTTSRP